MGLPAVELLHHVDGRALRRVDESSFLHKQPPSVCRHYPNRIRPPVLLSHRAPDRGSGDGVSRAFIRPFVRRSARAFIPPALGGAVILESIPCDLGDNGTDDVARQSADGLFVAASLRCHVGFVSSDPGLVGEGCAKSGAASGHGATRSGTETKGTWKAAPQSRVGVGGQRQTRRGSGGGLEGAARAVHSRCGSPQQLHWPGRHFAGPPGHLCRGPLRRVSGRGFLARFVWPALYLHRCRCQYGVFGHADHDGEGVADVAVVADHVAGRSGHPSRQGRQCIPTVPACLGSAGRTCGTVYAGWLHSTPLLSSIC